MPPKTTTHIFDAPGSYHPYGSAKATSERKTISRAELEDILAHAVDGGFAPFYRPAGNLDFATWPWETQAGSEEMRGRTFARFQQLLNGLVDINPKMLSNAITIWADNDWRQMFNRQREFARAVKTLLPDIVLQACPNEYVDAQMVDNLNVFLGGRIPVWVTDAFGLPGRQTGFQLDTMRFPDYPIQGTTIFNNEHGWDLVNRDRIVPDIRRQESKLWFYYLGVTYIDMGCECLSFCQVHKMNGKRDNPDINPSPYTDWGTDFSDWDLVFSKLRAYADSKPGTYTNNATERIRYLLITGHTHGMRLPDGRLLFDFHTEPVRPFEVTGKIDDNGGNCLIDLDKCKNIYTHSMGGITPSGWVCVHAPSQVFLDTYNPGNIGEPGGLGNCWGPFGYDEISWFAMRPEYYRNAWLVYAYYKIQCLDPNCFFTMTFRKGIGIRTDRFAEYIAINPVAHLPNPLQNLLPPVAVSNGVPDRDHVDGWAAYAQIDTIKGIFAGSFESPYGWVLHNFSEEEVYARNPDNNVMSSLIFAGDDKIFYIGRDRRIHGYVKTGNPSNSWQTVSPSYAAQDFQNQPVANQMLAQSDLVASPDGKRLLYIGVDGFIYGFDIYNVWNYKYITSGISIPGMGFGGQYGFMTNELLNQGLRADCCLIYPTNERVYYIARHNNGATRVHGFIKENGVWKTVSPAYSAQDIYSQHVSSQAWAAGALTYDGNKGRLFYRDTNGFVRFYSIYNNWQYWYNELSVGNIQLIQNNIVVHGEMVVRSDRIYFVAKAIDSGKTYIYILLEEPGNSWHAISPSWAAHMYGWDAPVHIDDQEQPLGELAVTNDETMIAYIGKDGAVYYYDDPGNNGWNFRYRRMPGTLVRIWNSLQFRGNDTIFGVSPSVQNGPIELMGKVYCYQWERDYCRNPAINTIEGGQWRLGRGECYCPDEEYVKERSAPVIKDGDILVGVYRE